MFQTAQSESHRPRRGIDRLRGELTLLHDASTRTKIKGQEPFREYVGEEAQYLFRTVDRLAVFLFQERGASG